MDSHSFSFSPKALEEPAPTISKQNIGNSNKTLKKKKETDKLTFDFFLTLYK